PRRVHNYCLYRYPSQIPPRLNLSTPASQRLAVVRQVLPTYPVRTVRVGQRLHLLPPRHRAPRPHAPSPRWRPPRRPPAQRSDKHHLPRTVNPPRGHAETVMGPPPPVRTRGGHQVPVAVVLRPAE